MEGIKKNINKIVIAVVLIFIATFVYNYMNQPEPIEVVEVVAEDDDAVIARQIIEALNELERINIQYDFFTQTLEESHNLLAFYELFDFSEKDLREKEVGKNNPFLQRSSPFGPDAELESEGDGQVVEVNGQSSFGGAGQSEEIFESVPSDSSGSI